MVRPGEHSLSDFQSKPDEYLRRLASTGEPEVLTIDGEARLIVQDVAAYERLLDALDRAEAIAGIRRGLEAMQRGEGRPADEVFADLRRRIQERKAGAP